LKDKEKCLTSVCRLCHGGCGALLFVKQGRLIRVKPDPHSPFSRGYMCIKGLATPEIIYHPSRLLTPLKQKGKRGSNKWETVDWDTALDEIANKLDGIRKESGPEAVALGQGTGRHHYMHVIRFANSFGTPNWYEPGLSNCLLPRITVSQLTYGGFVVADYYGKIAPRTILFWGHNPIVSSADGELSFAVRRALRLGSFGIAVDPRRSETAKRCEMWLPVRPGTDDALALAMVHVIINEGIYDKEFVEKWTVGFSELKEHVSHCTPQWAEAITWIPAEDIVIAARRYAIDKPSVLEWGVSIEQNPKSLQTVRAVSLLRALTGNIDVPGGDILGMRIVRPYPVMKNQLPTNMIQKRIGGDQFKLLGGFQSLLPSAHVPSLFKAMRTGDPYLIRALLVFGSNPLVTVPNPREVYQSLMKLDLFVVTDMFMTPTAALADYVLPAAFWPEVNQIMEIPLVAENAILAQQKVVQVGLCRQDEEIMIALARRLDLPGSEESLEDILDYRLEPLGLNFKDLKEKSIVFPSHEYRKFEKRGFRTPSGKVELFCKTLERFGYDPMPSYKELPESPVEQPDLTAQFPYILITGSRRPEFFHSEHRQIPSLRERRPDPTAEMHPVIADRHGILNGDWVYVSSPRGRIKMKAVVTEDIQTGVINIDHGWWFPERQGPEFGMWESNANVLTSSAPPYDPAFGSYQLRGLLCSITRVDDG
jgi:thiosulfate reductase/polysulfide reductase chain A